MNEYMVLMVHEDDGTPRHAFVFTDRDAIVAAIQKCRAAKVHISMIVCEPQDTDYFDKLEPAAQQKAMFNRVIKWRV